MNTRYRVERILNEAEYMLQRQCTIRECAKAFGMSKSAIHKDMREKLPHIDNRLHKQVDKLLKENLEVRAIRGGESTKKRYEGCRRENNKYIA